MRKAALGLGVLIAIAIVGMVGWLAATPALLGAG
jgi:hypothetical protein